MANSLELYCENRPRCTYGVASQTPNAGDSFPSRFPQCGGDLIRADEYNGPEP